MYLLARFDPDTTWPTDLEFTLNLNRQLRSYDGVTLNITVDLFVWLVCLFGGWFACRLVGCFVCLVVVCLVGC